MHPELDRMLAEYNKVLASYEASEIELDEARAAISHLTAVDGSGRIWSINPDTGEFMCASPGMAPVPTSPDQFSGNTIPSGFTAPPDAWSTTQPAPATSWDTPTEYTPSSPRTRTRAPKTPRAGTGRLLGNRRLLIIIGAVLVVLVVVLVVRHPATTSPSTSTLPPASSVPPSTAPTTSPTSVPASTPPGTPTSAQMLAAFEGVSSGPSAESSLGQYVLTPGTHVDIVEHLAFFAGLAQMGATVNVTTPVRVGSHAVSNFTIRDGSTHQVLYSGHAVWVVHGGTWAMLTWPTFS